MSSKIIHTIADFKKFVFPLKIILVLLNSIIKLHTVQRNDPNVKRKDYSDKQNDYNAKRKDYNVKRNDNNVKRHE